MCWTWFKTIGHNSKVGPLSENFLPLLVSQADYGLDMWRERERCI